MWLLISLRIDKINVWLLLSDTLKIIYLAPSLKYLVTNRGINLNRLSYIDDKAFTKRLIWSSSSVVYYIISLSFIPYMNLNILRANCKTLQRLVDQQRTIQSDYFL